MRLDAVAQDLAGMLRSLDYAAHSVTIALGVDDNKYTDDWVRPNRVAFLQGYGFEVTVPEATLLRA